MLVYRYKVSLIYIFIICCHSLLNKYVPRVLLGVGERVGDLPSYSKLTLIWVTARPISKLRAPCLASFPARTMKTASGPQSVIML